MVIVSVAVLLVWRASPACGHDPSAWGGLFRSRDHGATWRSVTSGVFVSGALSLAISPADGNHLLLGGESGLRRSRNGGRDWIIEAPAVVVGAVFASAFSVDGRQALVSTGLGVFRGDGENLWRQASAPRDAMPARAIVRSGEVGRVYLIGWAGLFRSDDWGASWSSAANGLPDAPTTAFLVVHGSSEALYAVVQGAIWTSTDGARSWARRGAGISSAKVDALAADTRRPTRLWAAAGGRLFKSDDGGASWQSIGRAIPEPNTAVHAMTASDQAIVVTTDRGLYRTVDSGERWTLLVDDLPAHLEAGPLVRDPDDPATLYAGYSLIPQLELWQRAADREGALARVSVTSLAGGVVFLIVAALGAVAVLQRLGRYYRPPAKRAAANQTAQHGPMENRVR